MDWHIFPHSTGWRLRKHGSGRSIAHFNLRRDAITEARIQASKTNGVVYIHNSFGDVVIRIPEL